MDGRGLRIGARAAVVGAVAVMLVLSGCAGTSTRAGAPSSASPTSSPAAAEPSSEVETPASDPSDSPAARPTATTPPRPSVTVTCYDEDYDDVEVTITDVKAPDADFQRVWKQDLEGCDTPTRSKGELTSRESKAVKVAGYSRKHVVDLYSACLEDDPDDFYAQEDTMVSEDQASEIEGFLVMCPKHPQAKAWRATLTRSEKETALEKSGRVFGAGTFRVGKEIKPGTYVVTKVSDCYWERQDRAGNTIDNYFTNGARRVEVTIRSSDYAFSSEGCGQWRPAS